MYATLPNDHNRYPKDDIRAVYKKAEQNEVFLKQQEQYKYRASKPTDLLFLLGPSIIYYIFKEYCFVMVVYCVLSIFMQTDVAKTSGIAKGLQSLESIMKSFPSEVLVFPLTLIVSMVMQNLVNTYEEKIVFLSEFAFLVKQKIKSKHVRHRIIKLVNQMIGVCYHAMDNNIDLQSIRDYDGQLLYQDIKTHDGTYLDFQHYRTVSVIMDLIRAEDPSLEDVFLPELTKITHRLDRLQQYRATKVPFVYLSSGIIISNLYLLHQFIDMIPVGQEEVTFHTIFAFSLEFLIYYGFPKIATLMYYPYGTQGVTIDLYKHFITNVYRANVIADWEGRDPEFQERSVGDYIEPVASLDSKASAAPVGRVDSTARSDPMANVFQAVSL